jgi:hypothetical protein
VLISCGIATIEIPSKKRKQVTSCICFKAKSSACLQFRKEIELRLFLERFIQMKSGKDKNRKEEDQASGGERPVAIRTK